LPVTLTEFEAHLLNGHTTYLSWTSTEETDFDYYTIERSDDGIHFLPIQKIFSVPPTNGLRKYNFVDPTTITGTNYYRLAMTDKDGTVTYSAIQKISVAANAQQPIVVSITNGVVRLKANERITNLVVALYDASGRMISSTRNNTVLMATQSIALNIENSLIAKGVYAVRCSWGNGKNYQQLFVNQ
jgi:hypothetical protein